MEDIYARMGERIKEYRIAHSISQDELGKVLNLPKQAISKIEKGKRKINSDELDKVAEFFKEPYEAFIKKDFKFDYYPKNPYGSLPKFSVDFLDDLNHYLNKLNSYGPTGINDAKSFSLELTRVIKSILKEIIKDDEN